MARLEVRLEVVGGVTGGRARGGAGGGAGDGAGDGAGGKAGCEAGVGAGGRAGCVRLEMGLEAGLEVRPELGLKQRGFGGGAGWTAEVGLDEELKVRLLLLKTYYIFFEVFDKRIVYVHIQYTYTVYPPATPALIKKIIKFFSYIYKEIQTGAVAKSYITNGLLKYD